MEKNFSACTSTMAPDGWCKSREILLHEGVTLKGAVGSSIVLFKNHPRKALEKLSFLYWIVQTFCLQNIFNNGFLLTFANNSLGDCNLLLQLAVGVFLLWSSFLLRHNKSLIIGFMMIWSKLTKYGLIKINFFFLHPCYKIWKKVKKYHKKRAFFYDMLCKSEILMFHVNFLFCPY